MKKLVSFLFLAVIVSNCCTRDRCTTYHYVNGFPEKFYESAEYATARWTEFSGIPVTIASGDPTDLACGLRLMAKNSSEYVGLKIAMNKDFWAVHLSDDGSIALVLDSWPVEDQENRAKAILMHELGHEFFLEHIEDSTAIMGTDRWDPSLDYNESDWTECVRVGTCTIRRKSSIEFAEAAP